MKTPVSNKSMDVLLVGYADKCEEENRILIVELKQWSSISAKDPGRVYIREVKDCRRHPLKQLHLYENNLRDHHSGIQKMKNDGKKITFSRIAYLHNLKNPAELYTGMYKKWETEKVSIFGRDDKNKLIRILKSSFLNRANDDMIRILEDYEAVLGNEGLAGLKMSYQN